MLSKFEGKSKERVDREVGALRNCQSPNVIGFKGVYEVRKMVLSCIWLGMQGLQPFPLALIRPSVLRRTRILFISSWKGCLAVI